MSREVKEVYIWDNCSDKGFPFFIQSKTVVEVERLEEDKTGTPEYKLYLLLTQILFW